MTCQEFERHAPAYLAGALSEADAREVEAHAASCAACEALLDSRTRRDLSAFAPALPPELRMQTLAAVRARSTARSAARRWWAGGIAAAAAVVVLTLGVVRSVTHRSSDLADVAPAGAAVAVVDGPAATAATLAVRSSRGEFAALDEAARELEAALAATPDDAELRAFLASVTARRAELERQVKDAS